MGVECMHVLGADAALEPRDVAALRRWRADWRRGAPVIRIQSGCNSHARLGGQVACGLVARGTLGLRSSDACT